MGLNVARGFLKLHRLIMALRGLAGYLGKETKAQKERKDIPRFSAGLPWSFVVKLL